MYKRRISITKGMSDDEYASTSGCKQQSNQTADWRREAQIKQLERRLRILEEEAEMLKGAVLESVEESRKIITDIHLHFSTIRDCMLQRELGGEKSHCRGIQIVKDQRAGLLQILCQESNPSIVNKGLRTRANTKSCLDL